MRIGLQTKSQATETAGAPGCPNAHRPSESPTRTVDDAAY